MRSLLAVCLVPFTFATLAASAATPAENAIQRAMDSITKSPNHAPYYNALAMAYARRARESSDVAYYAKAEATLKKSFELAPDNFEGLKVKTWLELGRHEFAQALATASKLNKRSPDDVTVYGYLVDANAELGNYAAAVTAAQWMLDLRPGNVAGLTRAAYLRELHGDLSGALDLMHEAYESTAYSETEDRAWLLTQIAHLSLLASDLAGAERSAQSAIDLFPNYHYALGVLAQVRTAQARYAEAVTLQAARYQDAPHAENLFTLAEALELAGRRDEAAKAFQEFERQSLAESASTDNSNHELIAYYVDHAHQPRKALEIAELEFKRRQDVYTLDCHAWALAANGDYLRADAELKRALSVGVKDPRILAHARTVSERLAATAPATANHITLRGRVLDPQGKRVSGVAVSLSTGGVTAARVKTDQHGEFAVEDLASAQYSLRAEAVAFVPVSRQLDLPGAGPGAGPGADVVELRFSDLAGTKQSVVITARTLEPAVDLRNSEVFNKTLFTRDDQVFQQLNAGINAGQHEGGGKSLEIRRFGFNLDHGGVNGGLKVLLDDVQQNQGSQGHGQGYLGSLKALSPELIQDVTIINGPFSAEYGDFSGLGVVHIRQRETLPDEFTARLQAGAYDTGRAFLAFSPAPQKVDAYLAYDGSYSDGPFINAGRYRRDNVNANYTRTLDDSQKVGFRFIFGRNDFYSSGQIPLDLVAAGALDRFGYIDPSDGGRVKLGTLSTYYSKSFSNGDTLKLDGFLSRSLFDLYSNFTYFLNDPVRGDAFQQHDSRLQEGVNAQLAHTHKLFGGTAILTAGANFHDNQINVALFPREGRVPTGVTTRANAHVTNAAGYLQETVSFLNGRLILGAGLRFDEFRYGVSDRVNPESGGLQYAGRWQGKGSAAFTPTHSVPLTLTFNYGRGINSIDARGVVQRPDQPRIAATDFYQAGTSSNFGRVSLSTDLFLIDHSNEQVYIPDDGSFEFKGPSRSYGAEAKASVELTRHLSINAGLTKIFNSFYRGGDHRVYVDSAPHFVANAGLTLAAWHGWSGSLRMRAVNHYRLDGEDPSIAASGLTAFDLSVAKRITRAVELTFGLDNLTNRNYYETQNYFESRVAPDAPVIARIHATPAYPITAVAGVVLRFGGK